MREHEHDWSAWLTHDLWPQREFRTCRDRRCPTWGGALEFRLREKVRESEIVDAEVVES